MKEERTVDVPHALFLFLLFGWKLFAINTEVQPAVLPRSCMFLSHPAICARQPHRKFCKLLSPQWLSFEDEISNCKRTCHNEVWMTEVFVPHKYQRK